MFRQISMQRLIVYLLLFGMFPFFAVVFRFVAHKNSVESLKREMEMVREMSLLKERKQRQNRIVQAYFKDSDHFYFDKYLESLRFLEPEIKSLKEVVNNKHFAGDEQVVRRLEFLLGDGNHLFFTESDVQKFPLFQETVATQVHPVEVNVDNLQQILALIEGLSVGEFVSAPKRPELIVLEFRLEKKNALEDNEVYMLTMKLLKREFSL